MYKNNRVQGLIKKFFPSPAWKKLKVTFLFLKIVHNYNTCTRLLTLSINSNSSAVLTEADDTTLCQNLAISFFSI